MSTSNLVRTSALLAAVMLAACLVALATAIRPADAVFPGSNGKIAFSHQTGTTTGEIYAVNQDGSNPAPLTNDDAPEYDPAWSADGKKVVFERGDDLYKMSANGSRVIRLTNTQVDENEPTWSPTGRTIAFVRVGDIWLMNADGSGTPERLTARLEESFAPAWSPDGTKIAFTRISSRICEVRCYYNFDIYVIDAAASESETNQPQRLTDHPAYDWYPSWAPLGNRIAFASERDGNGNIYSMRADGTDETRLTIDRADDAEAAYSPTGRKIAFSSNRPGNYEIYVMDFDGTDEKRITSLTRADDEPDWQPLP